MPIQEKTELTPRQKEIVAEMSIGKSNKEIARSLNMAEATVKLHFTEIFRKLGVNNRARAIVKLGQFGADISKHPKELTDLEILEEFINSVSEAEETTFSRKIIMFGRAINKLSKT